MRFMLASGMLAWDGDETYVANQQFDPNALGRAVRKLTGLAAEPPPKG